MAFKSNGEWEERRVGDQFVGERGASSQSVAGIFGAVNEYDTGVSA